MRFQDLLCPGALGLPCLANATCSSPARQRRFRCHAVLVLLHDQVEADAAVADADGAPFVRPKRDTFDMKWQPAREFPWITSDAQRYDPPRFSIFAQVSRRVTVRLKTGFPGAESVSTQK